jgi:hypothetical protein
MPESSSADTNTLAANDVKGNLPLCGGCLRRGSLHGQRCSQGLLPLRYVSASNWKRIRGAGVGPSRQVAWTKTVPTVRSRWSAPKAGSTNAMDFY